MNQSSAMIFLGTVLLTVAIFGHGENGRYAFSHSVGENLTYAKLDTRTGEAWVCGVYFDACVPIADKGAYLAFVSRSGSSPMTLLHSDLPDDLKAKAPDLAKTIDQLRAAGFNENEVRRWVDEQSHSPPK
jgi:hypothetical protein